MKLPIVDMVESQVIATIRKEESINLAIDSQCNIAFVMTGNLLNIGDYVKRLKDGGMYVFIHLDFIEGIANDKSAIKYIASEWKPHGIITTRNHLIRVANDEGLSTILRIFLIDQSAVNKGIEMVNSCRPDAIEVLPGLMPRVISEMTEKTDLPVIAGGLIREKEEILAALKSGALATSIGTSKLWNCGI